MFQILMLMELSGCTHTGAHTRTHTYTHMHICICIYIRTYTPTCLLYYMICNIIIVHINPSFTRFFFYYLTLSPIQSRSLFIYLYIINIYKLICQQVYKRGRGFQIAILGCRQMFKISHKFLLIFLIYLSPIKNLLY